MNSGQLNELPWSLLWLQALHEALVALLFKLLSPFGSPAYSYGGKDHYERDQDGVEELGG